MLCTKGVVDLQTGEIRCWIIKQLQRIEAATCTRRKDGLWKHGVKICFVVLSDMVERSNKAWWAKRGYIVFHKGLAWMQRINIKKKKSLVCLDGLFNCRSVYWCRFRWRAKWSDRAKARSQWGHLKGFTPVCFLMCLVSSSDLANFQLHPSQLHL